MELQPVNAEKCVDILDKPTLFYYFKNRVEQVSTPFFYLLTLQFMQR